LSPSWKLGTVLEYQKVKTGRLAFPGRCFGGKNVNPLERIRQHMPELRNSYQVARLGIFGSFARGEANEASDVDILVEFTDCPDLFHFVRLQERLARILGRRVDLVTSDALKPLIKDRILSEVLYV